MLLPDLRQNLHSVSDSPKSLLIFQKDLKILPPTKLGARGSFMIITGMAFLLLSIKDYLRRVFYGTIGGSRPACCMWLRPCRLELHPSAHSLFEEVPTCRHVAGQTDSQLTTT